MKFSNICDNLDRHKTKQLIIGVLGVNIAFLIAGIQYEKITTMKYKNIMTGQEEFFRTTAGFIMIQRFIVWMLGLVYRQFTLPRSERVSISTKNSLSTGFIIYLSSIAQTESMYLVSYPLIIMAKSCNLLNVILVGIFCSRVINKQLKLGPKKIIVALAVTIGIVMFRYFDPKASFEDNKKTQITGLFLLLVSLFADGFIPDFQAQIKEKFKPAPIQMLIKLNKWTAICAFVQLIVTNQFLQMLNFCLEHRAFCWDLLLLSLTAFLGQIFVYRMIKEFKQHIVPFVVTTRKILTVGLSLIYFSHQTSIGQVSSIVIVFFATVYEFSDSIRKRKQKNLEVKNHKFQFEGSQTTELSQQTHGSKQPVIHENGFQKALTEEQIGSDNEKNRQ